MLAVVAASTAVAVVVALTAAEAAAPTVVEAAVIANQNRDNRDIRRAEDHSSALLVWDLR